MYRANQVDGSVRPWLLPLAAAMLFAGCGATEQSASRTGTAPAATPVMAAASPAEPAASPAASLVTPGAAMPGAVATTTAAGAIDVIYYYLPG